MKHQLTPGSDNASAVLLGGMVTHERLQASAARSGRVATPLLRELLEKQTPPSFADLARSCESVCRPLHLESSLVVLSPRATRLLDMELLRRERCVPVEVLDDLCVLAVREGCAERGVRAVRNALARDVIPVIADPEAIDAALDVLTSPRRATRRGPLRRKDSAIHARFRELVLEGEVLDAIRCGSPARSSGGDAA